jgi:hypothetical protein
MATTKHSLKVACNSKSSVATCSACDFRLVLPIGSKDFVIQQFQRACFAHVGVEAKS